MATSVTGAAAEDLSSRHRPGCVRPRPGIGGSTAVVLLFLPPALFLFTLFVALPMGEAAWYSFYNWNGYGSPTRLRRLAQLRAAVREPRVPHRADEQPAHHRGLAGHPAAARSGDGDPAGRPHARARRPSG